MLLCCQCLKQSLFTDYHHHICAIKKYKTIVCTPCSGDYSQAKRRVRRATRGDVVCIDDGATPKRQKANNNRGEILC